MIGHCGQSEEEKRRGLLPLVPPLAEPLFFWPFSTFHGKDSGKAPRPTISSPPPSIISLSTPINCSLSLSPFNSLSLFGTTSLSLLTVVRPIGTIIDGRLQRIARTGLLASRDAEEAGHGFPAAQSPLLAVVGCSWEGCNSLSCSAILRPSLVANVGANQFLVAFSS